MCPCFIFFSVCLENSAIRGNNSQDPPPEYELIPCLIEVALIQVRWFSVHASCQFSNHLKPDSFSLCFDPHIHFLLIPFAVNMWFLELVYIIALNMSKKFPSMQHDDVILGLGQFLSGNQLLAVPMVLISKLFSLSSL